MNAGHLLLRELRTERVELSPHDAAYLSRHHLNHLDLRPIRSDPTGWLVTPRDVCGVIPLPSGRTVHIEPKVPVGNLWHLLSQAWDVVEVSSPAPVGGVAGLLTGLMAAYVVELATLVGRGLTHGYTTRAEVLPTIRGRIDLSAQLRIPGSLPSRFACVYEGLEVTTPANRVLRAALEIARPYCAHEPRLRPALRRCAEALHSVPPGPVGRRELARVCTHAETAYYRAALALARLILEGCAASHHPGTRRAPALIVEMPRLFERFICRALARGLPSDLRARIGGPIIALDEDRRALLVPDVVVEAARGPVCVVDAKYKATGADPPGPVHEPRADDVYQMLAYCVGYGVSVAVLVYPQPRATPPLVIDLMRPRSGPSTKHAPRHARIHTLGIDLSGDRASVSARCRELCARVAAIARCG